MASKLDTQLSKMLVDRGLISAADEKVYLDESGKAKEGLYAFLLKRQAVAEEALLKCLSELTHISVIDLPSVRVDTDVVQKVPLKIAEYYKIVPIRLAKRKLTIAVSGPLDLRVQDDMRAHLGFEIEVNYAREQEVQEAIKRFYGFAAGTIGEMMAAQAQTKQPAAPPPSEQAYEKIENIDKLVGDASIAKLVNQIILEAYRKRATDIHLEPYRGKVKLRYRIDGILYNANVQPEINRFIQPILSRIKIMSNLNIVERRMPQDGRAIVKVEDTTLDLRVSSIPTPYGESVVIRMLPMNRIFNLSQLGLAARQQQIFEDLVKLPHGVIFITGPTGSGKSTTLYACLNKMNSDDRKIITIEDPVEYEMEGVTQIQVQSEIGLTFARGLRSMLRHDPDVMMVGEVRDLETAEIAIRVALTGHLVFSTLHTNDAASGVTRLIDIGVEPYLVASSLQAFIAQRLIRVICPKCKVEDKSPLNAEFKRQIARELGLKKDQAVTIRHGKGCNDCNNTGFWGRVAIYEVLLLNEKVKELVMKRATAGEIKRAAIASGMRTLRQDGWQKVIDGVTTPEEVLKVVEHDRDEEEAVAALGDDKKGPVVPGPRTWLTGSEPDAPRPEDRRLFMRLDRSVNVRYKIVKYKEAARKPGTAEEYTVTRNLSAGGVVFAAKESIPVGTILELKIELPGDDKAVECLARVIREEEVEPEKSYDLAACFLDLSSADRSRLEKFVERGERT